MGGDTAEKGEAVTGRGDGEEPNVMALEQEDGARSKELPGKLARGLP